MQRLREDKKHGIIHSVKSSPEQLKKVADILNIQNEDRERLLRDGNVSIVREAEDHEFKKGT